MKKGKKESHAEKYEAKKQKERTAGPGHILIAIHNVSMWSLSTGSEKSISFADSMICLSRDPACEHVIESSRHLF